MVSVILRYEQMYCLDSPHFSTNLERRANIDQHNILFIHFPDKMIQSKSHHDNVYSFWDIAVKQNHCYRKLIIYIYYHIRWRHQMDSFIFDVDGKIEL